MGAAKPNLTIAVDGQLLEPCPLGAPAEGQDTVLVHTLSQDLMYIVAHCIEVLMLIPNTQYEVWIIIYIIYI